MRESGRGPQDQGVRPRWQAVLKRCLPAEEFQRLRVLSRDWRENPFAYDGETGRFEVAERWADPAVGPPVSEADLDLLFKACDVLTDHVDELGPLPDTVRTGRAGQAETIELHYDFAARSAGRGVDDAQVADRFVELLRDEQAFRVTEEDLGLVRRVRVRFDFRGDFEYQAKKSRLDWMLELARRLKEGRPFQGRRL